jgi:nucleotide-binding universal stress UspA family protein
MSTPQFGRILVAVDDSPAALAAARLAVRLAAEYGAVLRFVHVLGDGELVRALATPAERGQQVDLRRSTASQALLRHVAAEATRAGVRAETVGLEGHPASLLLTDARDWAADLVVLGGSEEHGPGRAYVGTVTRHVLEFADRPVLVVPRPG